jgi:hypothetical protein
MTRVSKSRLRFFPKGEKGKAQGERKTTSSPPIDYLLTQKPNLWVLLVKSPWIPTVVFHILTVHL